MLRSCWLIGLFVVTQAAGVSTLPPALQPASVGSTSAAEETPEPYDPSGSGDTEVYTYDPDGRRDPFVSLLGRGTDSTAPRERPPGLAGLSINDVSLRGLVLSDGEYLAVMQAPDNKTYILRGDEQLFDGTVESITANGVVFLVDVNDPLSFVKQREVHRALGGGVEERQ